MITLKHVHPLIRLRLLRPLSSLAQPHHQPENECTRHQATMPPTTDHVLHFSYSCRSQGLTLCFNRQTATTSRDGMLTLPQRQQRDAMGGWMAMVATGTPTWKSWKAKFNLKVFGFSYKTGHRTNRFSGFSWGAPWDGGMSVKVELVEKCRVDEG